MVMLTQFECYDRRMFYRQCKSNHATMVWPIRRCQGSNQANQEALLNQTFPRVSGVSKASKGVSERSKVEQMSEQASRALRSEWVSKWVALLDDAVFSIGHSACILSRAVWPSPCALTLPLHCPCSSPFTQLYYFLRPARAALTGLYSYEIDSYKTSPVGHSMHPQLLYKRVFSIALWTDEPSYRDARTHLKKIYVRFQVTEAK